MDDFPRGKTLQLIIRHWQTIASALVCAVSIGVARGKFSSVEDRVSSIEQTRPEVTAAVSNHNDAEIAAIRLRIDQIQEDVSATRVDVARLCANFGLATPRGDDPPGWHDSRLSR